MGNDDGHAVWLQVLCTNGHALVTVWLHEWLAREGDDAVVALWPTSCMYFPWMPTGHGNILHQT